jgi:hypothetical protein
VEVNFTAIGEKNMELPRRKAMTQSVVLDKKLRGLAYEVSNKDVILVAQLAIISTIIC